MTKENQKTLYEHYKKNAVDGKTDKIRENSKKYAEDILKSYPDFEKKEEKPEVKTKSKGRK